MSLTKEVEFKPVVVKGEVVLFDIYYQGCWIGSARTPELVDQRVINFLKSIRRVK